MSKIDSVTTTIRLPKEVYRAAERIAAARDVSLNGFLRESLVQTLKQIEREEIDAQFSEMADDHIYQREALALCKEFAISDYEVGLA